MLFSDRIAHRRGATILPNNGVVDRFACYTIPDNGGLPLVGDTNSGNIRCRQVRLCKSQGDSRHLCFPDLNRIMLDPSGRRVYLPMFLLADRDDGTIVVEDD